MIRIAVTKLEAFRLCMVSDWFPLERFIEECKEKPEPNINMVRGRAFHLLMENPYKYVLDEDPEIMRCSGFEFFSDEIWPHIPGPFAQKEIKTSTVFQTSTIPVTVAGIADVIEGTTIEDHKLSRRSGFEGYVDSLQWRLYLEMFGLDRFTYNVFTYKERGEEQRIVTIKDVQNFTFYRYPEMLNDITTWLDLFLQFLEDQNLTKYFDKVEAKR